MVQKSQVAGPRALAGLSRGGSGWAIRTGDCLEILRTMNRESMHCCITSPPNWGLRDYGVAGQIGLEETPAKYVKRIVEVFREVRRVLRDDGTLWVHLGDSYAGSMRGSFKSDDAWDRFQARVKRKGFSPGIRQRTPYQQHGINVPGLKAKDLVGIPWRVALALQRDGWYLRQDIVYHKPNPTPEPVRDRCTSSHDYIFLLAKSHQYYFDADAIAEPAVNGTDLRNRRSVWLVKATPTRGMHIAPTPLGLFSPCVLAGCPPGGYVLDPFSGTATTGLVSLEEGRRFFGIELNPEYAATGRQRLANLSSQ